MKVIIFGDGLVVKNFENYAPDLFVLLKNKAEVIVSDCANQDFDNVPELFDESDKILMYDPFAFGGKFAPLSENLARFKNIKYIFSPYSFYDGLDLNLVKNFGIRYKNNAGANAKSVAQHALGLALTILEKFPLLAGMKINPDGSILGEEIFGKTAGIVGMGNIGFELYPLLLALGIKTVYFNRTKKEIDLPLVSFEDIFKQDLVFLTIAATEETRKMMVAIPSLLTKKNYLIDLSATDDLYNKKEVLRKLEREDFAGYGIELDNPNFMIPTKQCNYLATPHMAWATVDAEKRTMRRYLERAIKILEGKTDEIDFLV